MPKNKTKPKEELKEVETFEPHEQDASEYKRFLKNIVRSNSARVDRDIVFLKDFNMWEVRFAGPQFQAIMDTFTFKFKETAEKCVEYAKSFDDS